MATSGSSSVSATAHTTLRFSWSQSSQSVSNNSTTINWVLEEIQANGYISSGASKSWSVSVNGNNYSGSNTVGISSNTTRTLASGSTTIPHNADGTKSFSYSFSQQFDITYDGVWIGTKSGSGSGTLNSIARASTGSSTNANIGENITISINRASGSFTHTLRCSFHNINTTIANGVGTSYSWTLPTSFYAQIPNAKSSWGTIYIDTYNGSTFIGTTSCTFNAYVKESTNKPNISATVVDVNDKTIALTGDANKLIKYHSRIQFSITCSPKNSASTKGIYINYNGNSYTGGSGNSWTDYFSNVTSGKYICTVTDTRNFSTSTTVNKTLINYINPTCNLNTSLTADGVLVVRVSGNYFNGSFGASNNSLQVAYRYGMKNGSYGGWNYLTPTFNGNSYVATATVDNLDYEKEYMVQAWCGDVFYTNGTNNGVYSAEKPAFSKPIFDWGESDFNFNVPVYVNGSEVFSASNCQVSKSRSGECTSWRYPNGMQISVIKTYGTWNVNTAWGAVYSSPQIDGQLFDAPFIEPPTVTVNAYNTDSTAIMVCATTAPTTTNTCSVYLWKPVAQTETRTCIEFIAIGKWK